MHTSASIAYFTGHPQMPSRKTQEIINKLVRQGREKKATKTRVRFAAPYGSPSGHQEVTSTLPLAQVRSINVFQSTSSSLTMSASQLKEHGKFPTRQAFEVALRAKAAEDGTILKKEQSKDSTVNATTGKRIAGRSAWYCSAVEGNKKNTAMNKCTYQVNANEKQDGIWNVTYCDLQHSCPKGSPEKATAVPATGKPKTVKKKVAPIATVYKASANPANMPPRASTSALPSATHQRQTSTTPATPVVEEIRDTQTFENREKFEKAARKFAASCNVELAIINSGPENKSYKTYMHLCCNYGGTKGWSDPTKRCTWQIHAGLKSTTDNWAVNHVDYSHAHVDVVMQESEALFGESFELPVEELIEEPFEELIEEPIEDAIMDEPAEESDDSIDEPLSATASPLPKAPSPIVTKKRPPPESAPRAGKRQKSVSKPRLVDAVGEALALTKDQSTWQEKDKSAPKRVLPPNAMFRNIKEFKEQVVKDLRPEGDLGWKLELAKDERKEGKKLYKCSVDSCPLKVILKQDDKHGSWRIAKSNYNHSAHSLTTPPTSPPTSPVNEGTGGQAAMSEVSEEDSSDEEQLAKLPKEVYQRAATFKRDPAPPDRSRINNSAPPVSPSAASKAALLASMGSFKYRAPDRPATVAPEVPVASTSALAPTPVSQPAVLNGPAKEEVKAMPPPVRRLAHGKRSSLPPSNSRQTTPTVDPRLAANRPSPPQPVAESRPSPPPLQIKTSLPEPDAVSVRSTVSPVIASATLPPTLAVSGPMKGLYDFLDGLHEGLGNTCTSVLWKAGVQDVKRLEKMGAQRWEKFHDQVVKKDLAPFDSFMLRDEVSKWIASQENV